MNDNNDVEVNLFFCSAEQLCTLTRCLLPLWNEQNSQLYTPLRVTTICHSNPVKRGTLYTGMAYTSGKLRLIEVPFAGFIPM